MSDCGPRTKGTNVGLSLLVGLSAAASFLAAPPGSAAAPTPVAAPPKTASEPVQRNRKHQPEITRNLDCSSCHTPESWRSLGAAAGDSGFDHSKTGFPLTQRHRAVACTDCHRADRTITRSCAGCHQDAHGGRLGSACDSCHSSAGWHATEAFARHRLTRLPLTGMHALVECRDCHVRTTDGQWSTLPAECFACHSADYRRPGVHPVHTGEPGNPEAPPFPTDCTLCHRTTAWAPAFVPTSLGIAGFGLGSVREHDRVFALSFGPHRGAACQSCHTSSASPAQVRCVGCHAHSEVRMRQVHKTVAAAPGRCLSCHPGGQAR